MTFTRERLRELYSRRARFYHLTARLYALAGFRYGAYRRMTVDALHLSPGDTAVEIGCGTGVNLPRVRRAVGAEGRIVGVDMTPEMLARAQRRVEASGWENVELVRTDAAAYEFPPGCRGIFSTLALTLVPEYDSLIARATAALAPGGRFAVCDFKLPPRWPRWLVSLWVRASRPFGVTLDLAERHPWESVERYLQPEIFRELYFGAAYLSVGVRSGSASSSGETEASTELSR